MLHITTVQTDLFSNHPPPLKCADVLSVTVPLTTSALTGVLMITEEIMQICLCACQQFFLESELSFELNSLQSPADGERVKHVLAVYMLELSRILK